MRLRGALAGANEDFEGAMRCCTNADFEIGHSSGWDMMTGIMIGITGILAMRLDLDRAKDPIEYAERSIGYAKGSIACGVANTIMRMATKSEKSEKSKDEWREALTLGAAYKVLREEGTERSFSSQLNDEHRKGTFVCAGCGHSLVQVRHEIRQRYRLAEFLYHDRERIRHKIGPQTVYATHRVPLRKLRWSSRPCF